MQYIKEKQDGSKWYHKDYPGFNVEANVHEYDEREYSWSIWFVNGKEIASGKAVSLKQSEYLCDQAVRDANLPRTPSQWYEDIDYGRGDYD